MRITTYLLLFIPSLLYSQKEIDTLWVGNFGYIKKVKNDTYDEKKSISIKIINQPKKETSKLSHILKNIEGDSNSIAVEIGTYKIEEEKIILYSFWCWQGDLPVSPWGARKQVYKVTSKGKLKKINSSLYIISGREGFPENKGVEFLYKIPRNEKEKAIYLSYIKKMESTYKSKFVFGEKSDELILEVKEKLKKYLKDLKTDWNKLENPFGYKI